MKKWKFFGREFEWYDIKTKSKKLLRGLFYSAFMQNIVCFLIVGYMWFVYLSSRKKFVGNDNFLQITNLNKPFILASWHNRLMMMPFLAYHIKKFYPQQEFITLASNHGDGRFVGRVMEVFGFVNVYGSSNQGRKKSRGIELHSLREILRGLKNKKALGITPDGPRGPNQKINSEIVNIARISGAAIIPISYSSSRFKCFKSWDRFKLPLPFAKISFYFGDVMQVKSDLTKEEEAALRLELEMMMNDAQKKADEEVK